MIWLSIPAVCLLFLGVGGQQTTVHVWPSSCSLQPSTQVNHTPTSSATPLPGLEDPFLVFVDFSNDLNKRIEALYIADTGSLTSDPYTAAQFELKSGRLRTKVGYISTSGQARSQVFAASPITLPMTTTFSIGQDSGLRWTSDLFFGGQARFCLLNSIVNVDFSGELPLGCVLLKLGTIDVSSVLGESSGSQTEAVTTAASTLTMIEPGSYSATFSLSSLGTSNQAISSSRPPNPSFTSTPMADPTSGSAILSWTNSGSVTSTSSIAYSAPTSTGAPTCEKGSKFDGTINTKYLILCNTPLPGSNLVELSAVNFASCISQCTSYSSQSDTFCVAVEYVASLTGSECRLKSSIPEVRRNSDELVQAAILVNVPGAPDIVFIEPGSTLSGVESTTSGDTATRAASSLSPSTRPMTSSLTLVVSPTTTPVFITGSQTGGVLSPTLPSAPTASTVRISLQTSPPLPSSTTRSSDQSATQLSTANTVTVGSTSLQGPPLHTVTLPSSTIRGSSFSNSFPSTLNPTTAPSSTTSASSALCPNRDNQVLNVNNDGYNYEILCNNDIQGQSLTANATWASSFQDCISQCTLYNVAIPFTCIGIKFVGVEGLAGTNNCFLMSSYSGKSCLDKVHAARLIYGGYQNPTGGACVARTTSVVNSLTSQSAPSTVSAGFSPSSRPTSPGTGSSTLFSTAQMASSTTTAAVASSGALVSTRTETRSSGSSTAVSFNTGVSSNQPSSASSSLPFQTISASGETAPPSTSSSIPARASSSTSSMITSIAIPTTSTTPRVATSSTSSATTVRTSTSTLSVMPPYTATPCPSPQNGTLDPEIGPVSLECQAGQPQDAVCYGYAFDFNNDPSNPKPGFRYDGWVNYEIECSTKFGGREMAPAYSPGRANDLFDCIKSCDEATREYPNDPSPRCVGVTFIDNATIPQNGNFGDNNCFKFNQINCASRGMNSSYQSARLLYGGYAVMNDYDPSFNC